MNLEAAYFTVVLVLMAVSVVVSASIAINHDNDRKSVVLVAANLAVIGLIYGSGFYLLIVFCCVAAMSIVLHRLNQPVPEHADS